MRRISLLLLVPAALFADLQVLIETPNGLQTLPPFYSVGATSPSEPLDTRFRLVNTGSDPVQLTALDAKGTGFSVHGISMPLTLAPGALIEFRVRFLPAGEGSYSALMNVAGSAYILHAFAQSAVSLACEKDGMRIPVPRGSWIEFGSAAVNRPVERICYLENRSDIPVGVARIDIESASATGPGLPLTIEPGGSVPLRLRMTAALPETVSGRLTIDGQIFMLRLTGLAQLSGASIVADRDVLASGQQVRIRVHFSGSVPSDSNGALQVEFFPDSGHPDDPAVRFTTGRTAAFKITGGESIARFGSNDYVTLQTGTLAGRIVIRMTASGGEATREFRTEPALIAIDDAGAVRTNGAIIVSAAGFDNTRSAASLRFRFADRAGNPLGEAFLLQPEQEWRSYYSSSTRGGVFAIRVVFPVTGDASLVGSVTAEIANGVGQTSLGRLSLP